MVNCAAFGCKSHSQKKVLGITFHRFPRDPRKKALWIKNINNPDWSPTIYDRICSLHFERRFFYETDLRKRLLGEAVPTIFPDRSGYLQSKKKRMTKKPRNKTEQADHEITKKSMQESGVHLEENEMPCCSAINCSNRDSRDTKKVSLFRFPADKTRREKWIQNTCRLSWTPTSSSRLCEEHFEESQFESKRADNVRKLKPNAVPTLFDVPNSPTRIDPIPRKSLYQVFYNPEVSSESEQESQENLKMGGSYCAVNGCWGSKESKHRFPNPKNDIQLFQRWVAVCCNENLLRKTPEQVYNNSRVCKLHFLTSDFGPNNKLKKNSIPSLNMPALDEKRLNESIVSDVKLSQREDTVILPSPCIDPEEVSIGEILRVCRTCLKIVKRQDTVSLVPYNSNNNTELYKKLKELLGLDLLPVANPCVCKDCENFINAVHDFREACHANEMVLKEFDWGSKPKDLLHIVDQDAVKKVYSECCLGPKDIYSDSVVEKDIAPSTQETIIIEPDLVNNLTKEGEKIDFEDRRNPLNETNKINNNTSGKIASRLLKEDIDIFSPVVGDYLQKVGGRITQRLQKKIKKYHINDEGSGPFICEICGKLQNSKASYRQHIKGHTFRKGFRCQECNKIFSEWCSYRSHCKLLHGGFPKCFKCSSCNKQYHNQKLLDSHVKIHQIENANHSCMICRKAFDNREDFERHRVIHRPVKTVCKFCRLSIFKHDLRRHIKSKHSTSNIMGMNNRKKLFECDICQRRYFKERCLKLHKILCHEFDSVLSQKFIDKGNIADGIEEKV